MADKAKAKSAKERLEAAKKSAQEAEIVEAKVDDASVAEAVKEAADGASESVTEIADKSSGGPDAQVVEGLDDDAVAEESSGIGDDPSSTDSGAVTADENTSSDSKIDIEDQADQGELADEAEEQSGSLAATALKFIAIVFVGAALALWAGPKIAPNLPGWASPLAAFLTPGVNETSARIDEVSAQNKKQIEALSAEIDASTEAAASAEAKASDALAAVEAARADLGADIAAVAEEPRADLERLNELATRLVEAEATVTGLRAEIDALGATSSEDAAPSAEVLERVAAFGASVEGLRAEIADLKSRSAQIEALARSEDLAALADRVAALEDGEAATAGARDEATDIRREANLAAAITRIEQALLAGAPYASALSDATSLSGESAPEALSASAATGLPTQEALLSGFPTAAQAAYAAALEETAGDGFANNVFAKLQGRLGGRPSVETEGDDAGAILSRVEARLKEGRLNDANAEASKLSEAAQTAMSAWLTNLIRATEGAAAFSTYRNALTTN